MMERLVSEAHAQLGLGLDKDGEFLEGGVKGSYQEVEHQQTLTQYLGRPLPSDD